MTQTVTQHHPCREPKESMLLRDRLTKLLPKPHPRFPFSLAFEVQFDQGGSATPSAIHQVEGFSVLIHLGLVIARGADLGLRFWISNLEAP
ncbi:hypothetical protein VNO77_33138 [Canavalia gladiata]|uniref:Uncharacterized protein n=1 Tax=Canavalia gladiata TaxID=3824 RepID=A0AAN9KD81_CANGL